MPRAEYRQPVRLFERVMFGAMVPGLAVPVVAAVALVLIRSSQDDGHNYGLYAVPVFVALPYLFILLGSELLRTWKWLRHPSTLVTPALPRGSAVTRAVIYLLTLIFPLTFLRGSPLGIALVLGLIIAGLAIYDHSLLQARPAAPFEPFTEARPVFVSRAPYVLAVLVVIALAAGITGTAVGSLPAVVIATLVLVALALPWSYAGIVVAFFATAIVQTPHTFMVVLAMTAAINIVIAWRIARDDVSYAAFATWFFRLNAPAEPPAPQ